MIKNIIIGALGIITIGIVTLNIIATKEALEYEWIAGETGSKCYEERSYHQNIEYHKYFKTLEECLEYVDRNKLEIK